MKRDMELIREILLFIKEKSTVGIERVKVDGYNDDVIDRHVEMLVAAGLVEGSRRPSGRSDAHWMVVTDMSWEGHDFLATLENTGVWAQIKQKFSAAEIASMPLGILKDVGVGLLSQWAKEKAGLA